SVSTTTTIAILAGAELQLVAPNGGPAELVAAAATLTVLVGALLLLASLLRLGFVANFISEPVLAGFKSGIAVVIVVDQLPNLLGIHFDKAGFLANVVSLARHVPETSLPTLLLAALMFALILGLERFAPRAPTPLVAVGIGIALSALLGTRAGFETVGAIPRGLPAPALPPLALA